MKSALLVLALCLGLAAAISLPKKPHTEDEYRTAFIAWMSKHNKQYTSDEFFSRYDIFRANMDYVNTWNAQNSTTVLGLNIMADLSNAEYQRIYLGTHIDGTAALKAAASTPFIAPATPLAVNIDWRTKGAVTDIKDQGQCGSCWAFSTIATTEAAHFFSTSKLVSLSEQQLVDCSGSFGNDGCDGGLMDNGFKYIISNPGVDTEASYPYTAVDGACKFSAASVGATLKSFTDVKAGNEAALTTAINTSPISVAIDASRTSFQLYESGVYYEPKCSSSALDHGVTAVGYGTDDTSKADYYIVKNSWGTTWGTKGYILMTRNKNNNCGIATAASWPTA